MYPDWVWIYVNFLKSVTNDLSIFYVYNDMFLQKKIFTPNAHAASLELFPKYTATLWLYLTTDHTKISCK